MHSVESDCLTAYTALDPVFSLEVLHNMFICGSFSGTIKGYDLENGATTLELRGHTDTVKQMSAGHTEAGHPPTTLFSCSTDGTARKWCLDSGANTATFEGHIGAVESLCVAPFSPSTLVTGGADGCVRFWDTESAECVRNIRAHIGRVEGVLLVRNILYTCSSDGLCKAIDAEKGQLIAVFEGTVPIKCMMVVQQQQDQDETKMFCGCSDGCVRLYDTRTANCVQKLVGHKELVYSVVMHEGVVYSSSDDTTIKHWSLSTSTCDYTYEGHTDGVPCLAVTNVGALYSGSFDKSVRVWDCDGVLEKIRIMKLLDDKALSTTPFPFGSSSTTTNKSTNGSLASNNLNRTGRPPSGGSTRGRPSSAKGTRGASKGRKRGSSATSRPTSAKSTTSSSSFGGSKKASPTAATTSKQSRAALEVDLSSFNDGNLSSIHKAFLRHCTDQGQLGWTEFQRCLQFLGVSAQPLAQKVFSVMQVKGLLNYRQFIRDVNRLVNGNEKERILRGCFNLYDTSKLGSLLKRDIETAKKDVSNRKMGRNEMQARCMLELFGFDETKTVLTYDEFREAMASNCKLVQSFFTNILLQLDQVAS
eukprot:TRINITY_DN64651_c0_g1_i2.p1 TRINITY_DN64651_c0_g1~~TRINITY_DN64651_c0_g1_i2.p1  ORF type:complete len:600 (-),score=55.19 TRINITY_DN64651_c0_g1_i2:42-1805(-)